LVGYFCEYNGTCLTYAPSGVTVGGCTSGIYNGTGASAANLVCFSCQAGYSLVTNSCILCPTGCLTCSSTTACTLAAVGFSIP